jgi:hypothetical protein
VPVINRKKDETLHSPLDFSDAKARNRTKILVSTAVIIAGLIAASLLNLLILSDYSAQSMSSLVGVIIFGIIGAALYGAGYYLLSRLVKDVDRRILAENPGRYGSFFHSMYQIIRILFFVNAGLFTVYFIQMVMTSQYSISFGITSAMSLAVFTATIFSVLSYKFFSWYKLRRDTAIFLYGLSFAIVVFNAGWNIFTNASVMAESPARVEIPLPLGMEYQSDSNVKSSAAGDAFFLRLIPSRVALGLYWLATVMLLRNYSNQIGAVKYWTLTVLPLAAMLIGSVFIFGGFGSSTVLFRASISGAAFYASGILFAVLFLIMARVVRKENHKTVAHHLTVCAIGVMIFLVAGAGSASHLVDWIHVPYPPFFFYFNYFSSLGVFLYSVGFYFAAIAISKDVGVRKSIKHLASRESELFDNLGVAALQEELQRRVIRITKDQQELLEVQTGSQQQSTDEEELKSYLKEALVEVRKTRLNS